MISSPSKNEKSTPPIPPDPQKPSMFFKIFKFFDNLLGFLVLLSLSSLFGYYMYALHEARLWFSNIRDIEREISMRTESGLYYSYYKQLVNEPNISVGLYNLMHDRITEYPREINILERFNIYQEVFLAIFYRNFVSTLFHGINPILFYTYACFVFSGFTVFFIGLLGWKTSNHWLFGLLACAWMFSNLDDSTRVFFTVNLREMFAFPIFWLQNCLTLSLLSENSCTTTQRSLFYMMSTFFFTLFWQFNQFILFLQSLALFGMCLIFPEMMPKVRKIIFLQSFSFVLVICAQFFQPMMISSVSLSLNLSIFLVFSLFSWKTTRFCLTSIIIRGIFVVVFTGVFQILVKKALDVKSDTHIWNFVKAKFGLGVDELPFETAIYICHGAFQFLDYGFVERTKKTGVLPMYGLTVVLVIFFTLKSWLKSSTSRHAFFDPKILFLTLQSILCGIMAILTLRMKFLWFPQMAILAAHGVYLLDKFIGRFPKFVLILALAVGLLHAQYGEYQKQMANEQEFYDPDTVQLMEWINTLPRSSVFTGSMQLLAGVKACTGRPLTNHPHFEDKWLRERTQRLYQVYGRRSILDVHKILTLEGTNYIILEDSICMARSDGCGTNDLVDISNGHLPDGGYSKFASNLKRSDTPRFCDLIRKQTDEMKRFFKSVFENRTFRVYKVM